MRPCSPTPNTPSPAPSPFVGPAQVLAHYARHRAADSKFASPFAYAAFQAGFSYMGGKMDDITVVIAKVIAPPSGQHTAKL